MPAEYKRRPLEKMMDLTMFTCLLKVGNQFQTALNDYVNEPDEVIPSIIRMICMMIYKNAIIMKDV